MAQPPADHLINDRYRLLRQLGAGSTGRVYAAWDTHVEREVAIKILDKSFRNDADLQKRFDREIRTTSQLQHPGIVVLFESGELPDGDRCYVMTIARGHSLEDYIERLKKSPDHWKQVTLIDRLTLFLKLLEVISYAHSEEVVHRDLKPANIMLGAYGEVWVLDWGLARNLREEREPELADSPDVTYDDLFGKDERKKGAATVILKEQTTDVSPGTAPELGVSSLTRGHRRPDAEPSQRPTTERRIRTPLPDDLTPAAGAAQVTEPQTTSRPDARTHISTRVDAEEDGHRPSTTSLGRSSEHGLERRTDNGGGGDGASQARDTSRSSRQSSSRSGRVPTMSARRSSSYAKQERSTQLGEVLGSPAYMSPEQARGAAGAADKRADIYSLGAILTELLTMHAPAEMGPDEKLPAFIKRIISGQRRSLRDLWPEAPRALHDLVERALALDPQDRLSDCETFAGELRHLLAELSASYSELERQRLAKEREGAWHNAGTWDFAATPGLGPFTEQPRAYESEPVGQVMHPELGGLLVGGWGLQIYPLTVGVGNDLRLMIDAEVVRGSEFWIFLRGVPPAPCYQFRIGSYGGRWLAIGRSQGEHDLNSPELLTMRPLRRGSTTAIDMGRKVRLHRVKVVIEVVGSRLAMSLDDQPQLVVQDTCPLSGPLTRQLGIGTLESHAILRSVTVQQRRSPLMLPAFAVANELLRQNLYPQAIDQYRTFLAEHPDSSEAIEADFMLCLAFLRAGHSAQAERELRQFLSDNLEHPLAQDAIFELARLVMEQSGAIERAVRVVLSYQESGDFVRSRFSLLLMPHLQERVRTKGLTANLIGDLERVRQLIRGSPDEELILVTMSQLLRLDAQTWANHQLDTENETELDVHRRASERLASLGFHLSGGQRRTEAEYDRMAKRLIERDDIEEARVLLHFGSFDPIELGDLVRDVFALLDRGCGPLLLRVLGSMELRPLEIAVRAVVAMREGVKAAARDDLERCFKLTDVLETDRSDPNVLFAARFGCYGLGLLPWALVWESLVQGLSNHLFAPVVIIAASLAEGLGNRDDAAQAYARAAQPGSGFLHLARSGQRRLEAASVSPGKT